MSTYFVEVTICDDLGTNCQAPVLIDSLSLPTSDGWFGLQAGTTEYWDVVIAFAFLMGTVWASKAIIKFVRK